MALSAVVVIPAQNEAETIVACLEALAAQTLGRDRFATILVLDGCTDATGALAVGAAAELELELVTVAGPGQGAGAARRLGMSLAAARLRGAGCPEGLIASTDADSRPAPDWLERQLGHLDAGIQAVAGLIELDAPGRTELPVGVLERRERDAIERLHRVRRLDPEAEHHHFSGASLGITAAAYEAVGGLEPLPALEDAAFAGRLQEHAIPVLRARDVRVLTSARRRGRVSRGLSVDLDVSLWLERRRYRAADFTLDFLLEHKGTQGVTVIVPTKRCAETIAEVIGITVSPFAEAGVVDRLVVVDAGSEDGTAELARAAGAQVLLQDEVGAEFGPALGKGDAMWRALLATSGEIVCFLDGDTLDPTPGHLAGLLGPILSEPEISLVKGAFARPLAAGGGVVAHEGGRVTELMARPLLNLHAPHLAGFAQPLAGEFSARRNLLEAIPFPVGYGVEIAILIEAWRRHGLEGLAECDLGKRQNRHQPLRALGEMAYAVLAAVERRHGSAEKVIAGSYLRPWDGGSIAAVPINERPPAALVRRTRSGAGVGSGSGPGSGSIGVAGSWGAGTSGGSAGSDGVPGSGSIGVTGASGTTGVGDSEG